MQHRYSYEDIVVRVYTDSDKESWVFGCKDVQSDMLTHVFRPIHGCMDMHSDMLTNMHAGLDMNPEHRCGISACGSLVTTASTAPTLDLLEIHRP